jgi:hypothetical protein
MRRTGTAWLGLEGAVLVVLGIAASLIPAAAGPYEARGSGWLLALSEGVPDG